MLVRLLMTLDACLALISNSPAIALTRAPLVMGFAVFALAAFMLLGGNIVLSVGEDRGRVRGRKFAQVK